MPPIDKPYPRFFLILSIIFILIGLLATTLADKGFLVLWLNDSHNISLGQAFRYYTYLGSGWIFLVVVLVVVLRSYRLSIVLFFIAALQGLMSFLFKGFLLPHIKRPMAHFADLELNLVEGVNQLNYRSFPSGHTMTAFGIATFIAMFTNKFYLQLLLFLYAFLIAFSRIYLVLHFLRDTVAGAFLGMTITLLVVLVFRKYNLFNSPKFNQGLLG